jgi:hypothetical protein
MDRGKEMKLNRCRTLISLQDLVKRSKSTPSLAAFGVLTLACLEEGMGETLRDVKAWGNLVDDTLTKIAGEDLKEGTEISVLEFSKKKEVRPPSNF